MQTQNVHRHALPAPASSRHDVVRLCTVEVALVLRDALGARIAAEFLHRHDVDLNIALRVLLHPEQRRGHAG